MSEIELLPCIRCGGEMALHENDWADPPMWSAYCLAMETCGIHMPERLDRAEAIKVANFRSPPQVGRGMEEAKIIDRLLTLVYQVWCALDDSEVQQDDSIIVTPDNAKALNDALDAFDELPDDQPGYTMGPAAKARWALRSLIGTGDTSALSAPPAEEGKSPTAEDAARLILECTDIISEATAEKLAERIRSLGTGSREERSQADPGTRSA